MTRAARDRAAAVGAGALLFALNWCVSGKLAGIEFLRAMQSAEGAHIAISRYVAANWGDLTWFPLWYTGIPFQNTYTPLLYVLAACVSASGPFTAALGYHVVEAILYSLGPVLLGWLMWRWSDSRACGLAAGILYSLFCPSAFLIDNVRGDLGTVWNLRRLQTMVYYGDGPYVASLALVPLALLALDGALKRRTPLYYLGSALAMAAVVLTNWLGGSVLALAIVAYLLGRRDLRRVWTVAVGAGALAYALVSPWIPPSTVRTVQFNSETVGGVFVMGWHQLAYAVGMALLLVVLHLLFSRLAVPSHARAACFFLLLTAGITLLAEWGGVFLIPQPHRYHMAMDMAFAMAAACAVPLLWRRVPRGGRWAVVIAVAAVCVFQVSRLRNWADGLIQPIDIRSTTEYKTAQWFDRNLPGRRVMAPGSTSLFLNAFNDTPQLGGGFAQGAVDWYVRVAIYTLYSGQNAGARDGEISVLWLKALGVRAIAVGGPASGEYYKPIANPRKFEGLLDETWRDGDDRIYLVPSRTDSLAHVVRRGDLVASAPAHGLDVDQVRRYVTALEDTALPAASLQWLNRHQARIRGELHAGQVLSVQMSYHPGWRAEVAGRRVPMGSDKIGLAWIDPGCDGTCVVDLTYDGGREMHLAQGASAAAFAGCLIWALVDRRKRRREHNV